MTPPVGVGRTGSWSEAAVLLQQYPAVVVEGAMPANAREAWATATGSGTFPAADLEKNIDDIFENPPKGAVETRAEISY